MKKKPKEYSHDLSTIGGRIAKAMVGAKRTPEGIAQCLVVPIERVEDWLQNKGYPTEEQLDILSVYLKFEDGNDWLKTGCNNYIK